MLSYNETKQLIALVLEDPRDQARIKLSDALKLLGRNEGEFYSGIVEHGSAMGLTTEQWFELLSRLPNRILRSQLNLNGILSEHQIKQLPPVTG
jgi:hypothetical protein